MANKKVKCGYCKEYVLAVSAIRDNVQSFCSIEHKIAKANQKPAKKKADPTEDLLREVRDLDGNRCRFDGRHDSLHVHHVRYRSEGGLHEVANLLTLCNDCHGIVHSDKELWQPLCIELLELRGKTGDRLTLVPQLRKRSDSNNSAASG